jgi:hypothetical protein
MEKNKMNPARTSIAATAFACAALLSIAGAQAAADHAHAMKHVAAHHHHHMRGPVAAGADLAAGAVDTAGAVAAGAIGTAGAIAAAPFGAGPYAGNGYYGTSTWGDFDCSPGYAGCRPYASKDWSKP